MTDEIDVANIAISIAVSTGNPPDVSSDPLTIAIHPDAVPGGDLDDEASVGTFVFADLSGLSDTPSTRTAASQDGSGATKLTAGDYWVVIVSDVRPSPIL